MSRRRRGGSPVPGQTRGEEGTKGRSPCHGPGCPLPQLLLLTLTPLPWVKSLLLLLGVSCSLLSRGSRSRSKGPGPREGRRSQRQFMVRQGSGPEGTRLSTRPPPQVPFSDDSLFDHDSGVPELPPLVGDTVRP